MAQLNQINGVVEGVKAKSKEKLTAIYHHFQKPDLFYGHVRSYKPLGSDPATPEGEQLPDEKKNTQADGRSLLAKIIDHQSETLDIVYARDKGNTVAKADVKIGERVLLKDAPVPFLLWLGSQLDDLHTEVKKLPTLDPAEKWEFDTAQNRWATAAFEERRSRKIPRVLLLHEGTKEHAPQVKETTEDVRVGTYTTRKYSTAFPVKERDEMLARIEDLQKAVRFAREKANEQTVEKTEGIGKALYDFIFTGK